MDNYVEVRIDPDDGRVSDHDDFFDQVGYFAEPGAGRVQPTPVQRWQAYWQRVEQAWLNCDDRILTQAAGQGFVLRSDQAASLGMTRAQARWLVGRRRWRAPAIGVLAPLDVRLEAPWRAASTARTADERLVTRRELAVAATAAARRHPDRVVSGRSAAVLHGLPTFRDPDTPILTAAPSATLGRHGAVHTRGAALAPVDVGRWFGAGVTTPARTVIDLARLDRWDGVMAADAALHNRCVTEQELRASAARARGWPGVRQAREIMEFADARAESPLESLTRLRLHDDGFPPPDLQVEIATPGRRRPYRVDFVWPDRRVILEVDGRLKYRGDREWQEKGREIALRKLGYRVERLRWSDVVDDWLVTSRMLWTVLNASSPQPWS